MLRLDGPFSIRIIAAIVKSISPPSASVIVKSPIFTPEKALIELSFYETGTKLFLSITSF